MKILLLLSVVLGLFSVALTGYEVSSGLWILALLITGVCFSILFLYYWRGQKKRFAVFVGLLFLLLGGACILLGEVLDGNARKNSQLVIEAIKRYEKRAGHFPNLTLDLKAPDLDNQIDRTYLAPGRRFWVMRNLDGSDACVIREAFPFGKRIRCSKWDSEREVFD